MARSLERVWPHVVSVGRRFRRPQHIVRGAWRGFSTPLKPKPGVDLNEPPNEYGMRVKLRGKIKSQDVLDMLAKSGLAPDQHQTEPPAST